MENIANNPDYATNQLSYIYLRDKQLTTTTLTEQGGQLDQGSMMAVLRS